MTEINLNPEWLQRKEAEEVQAAALAAQQNAEVISEGTGEVIPPMVEDTPQQLVDAAKAEAAIPEKPMAEAGPMAEIPVPTRDLAWAITQYLVMQHEDFLGIMSAMIASRQLYAVAVRDMEYRLTQLGPKQQKETIDQAIAQVKAALEGKPDEEAKKILDSLTQASSEDAWGLVEEFMMTASANKGAEPFTEHVLKLGLNQTVLPWLDRVVKMHDKWAANERQKALDDWEVARRAKDIPLNFRWDESIGNLLPRKRSVVLYGWEPAVRWILDQLVTSVLTLQGEQLFTVLRLMRQAGKIETQTRLFRLGGKDWEDCCRGSASFPKLFADKIMDHLSEPVDLIICDDIAWAGKSAGLVGGTPARKGGAAHRRFRKFCDDVGSAFVGGLPLESKSLDFPATPDWEQLRVFTTLRAVSVEDAEVPEGQEPRYKLTVGNGLATFLVEKRLLDESASSRIILA